MAAWYIGRIGIGVAEQYSTDEARMGSVESITDAESEGRAANDRIVIRHCSARRAVGG